ncbi:hypothetical protein [Hyphobacterium sp.]|uniref:hypothetical protein n=1 Tax=Hyphobacterium sp. TaxID=2004662 RepID=UPI003749939D
MRAIIKMIGGLRFSAIIFWMLALAFLTMTAFSWLATGEIVAGWAAAAFSMLVVALVITAMTIWQAAESTTKMDRNA